MWPDASARAPRSSATTRGDLGQADLLVLDPDPARRPSGRGRAGRSRASSAARPGSASSRGTPCRVVSSRSSSARSSRKPARENSGVRSSCEALATNSLRARSSCASWTRMRSNEAGQLADLVRSVVDDRLVERPLRDPVGRALQPAEPARVDRGDREAEHDGDQQRDDGRVEQPPLDERDRRELVGERAREEHHVARGEQRHGDLGVLAAVVADAGAHGPHRLSRPRARSSPSRSPSLRPRTSPPARAAPACRGCRRPRRRRRASWRRTRRRRRSRRAAGCSAPRARRS